MQVVPGPTLSHISVRSVLNSSCLQELPVRHHGPSDQSQHIQTKLQSIRNTESHESITLQLKVLSPYTNLLSHHQFSLDNLSWDPASLLRPWTDHISSRSVIIDSSWVSRWSAIKHLMKRFARVFHPWLEKKTRTCFIFLQYAFDWQLLDISL